MRIFQHKLGVWLLVLCAAAAQAAEPAAPPAWDDDLTVRAVLFPIQQAMVAASVESSVEKVNCRDGESFSVGDVLIELDKRAFSQRCEKAQALLRQAESDLDFAKISLTRTETLYDKDMAGDEMLERARHDVTTAESRIELQKAELALAEQELSNCNIAAPFDGRVVKRLVNTHEYVRPGQQLMLLIDDTKVLAAMHLPSHLRRRIKIGDELVIAVDDRPGRTYTGTLYELSGDIDAASRTFEAKLLIDNASGELIAGMAGKLISELSAPAGEDL